MLKKCTFSILFTMLAMAGVANAATLDIPEDLFVEQDLEGCYLLKDKYDLYWFANKVNTENTTYATACAKLTADIVVNEHVLTDAQGTECVASSGSYNICSEEFRNSLYGWTPIGSSDNPFAGTFDGLGHTISGLYDGRETSYTGLFGYVSGTNAKVSIKNVGVEDSYFRVKSYAGGIVGMVYDGSGVLNIENVYNASTFYFKGDGYVGGLIGRVGENWTLNITNAYNSGSIFGTEKNNVAGLVGCISSSATVKNAFNYGNLNGNAPLVNSNATVTNSFYLGDAAQGGYGVNKSASDFSDGTVLNLLKDGENGFVWQSGSPNPTLLINSHKADLIYLGDAVSRGLIYFIEGFGYAKSLPTIHLDGSPILGWYENQSFTGTKYTEIPADVKRDLQLYPKLYKPVDGCYEISDADELYAYASIVNGTLAEERDAEPTACGKLTADIVVNQNVLGTDNANVNADGSYNNAQAASAFRVWTPIGNSTNKFQGTFNGKGHTISGLYFNNSSADNVGLFGYTSGAVTIDSVGVVDSYFRGDEYVGSIVGQAESTTVLGKLKALTVTRSFNKGVVTGTGNVGGLVGKNGNVKFSYNMGSVTGTSNVGGLVGSNILQGQNKFEINGSYNVGLVKMGTGSGNAVLGEGCPTGSQTGAVKNVYYLDGFGDACLGALPMTSYEFADGFVAIMLHNDPVNGANIWGQVVGADKTPTLTGEIKFLLNDGCFEIASEEDLYLFAGAVNNGVNSEVCAKLTADIKVNEHVLGTDNANIDATTGAYTGSTTGLREWTPIGNSDHPFIGTFDGDGHTISGLYFNDDAKKYVGLFGYVESSESVDVSIKNVGLEDSYFKAEGKVGGVVGLVGDNVDVKIENVYNAAVVTDGGSGYVGGIVGVFWAFDSPSALNILNSYNSGAVFGNNSVGGLVGDVDDETSASTVSIKNSYNYGAVTAFDNQGETLVGSVAGTSVNISDTYYLKNSALKSSHGGTEMSSTQFADGTVFAALRNAEDGEVWRQYKNDAYPTLAAKTGTGAPSPMHVATLHYSETDSVVIAYTEGTAKSLPTKDSEGNAIVGWTTSADGSGDVITEIPTSATTDLKLYPKIKTFEPNAEGFYEIATADDLYKFAEIVNSGTVPDAKAKLTADICVNACGEGESVLGTDNANVDADGNYIGAASASFREWTPIGIFDNPFNGTFDGQGHTISGLYFNDDEKPNVGLFGYVSGEGVTVSISNVGVEDSYFNAQSAVGGVVGWVDYASLDMKNVYNAAVVVGASFVGGVVGYVGLDSQTLSMTNVYNVGLINCEDVGQAGGLVGEFGNDSEESKVTIKNSYNYGEVVGGNSLVGYVESEYENVENVSVSNSYYLGDAAQSDYGTKKSSTEFADGTVFAALYNAEDGEVWRQYSDDDYPTLAEKKGTGVVPMHVITLHLPEKDSVFAYTEGAAGLLPAKLDDGSILIWYKDENLSGETYTQIAATENGDLAFYAKVMKLDSDGYYEIADADMLFKFAELVNTQNFTYRSAKVKLTADIVVNENVLTTASGTSNVNANGEYIGDDSDFRVWTPIGGYTDNSQMSFEGTFDGQGHTISGLYLNKGTAKGNEISALFGIVGGEEVSIKNVGIEDSYFAAQRYVGGIVGLSVADMLKIENCYNDATLYGIYGIAGLVGEINSNNRSLTIENSYNSGTIKYDLSSGGSPSATGALVGNAGGHANVINSYYLVQEGVVSEFGSAASSDAFANGTVATLLHGNGVDADSLWGQNVTGGESHPTFFKGINVEDGPGVIYNGSFSSITVTLHYSEDDADTSKFEHVVGIIEKLPATDKNGNFVLGWYKNATFADEKYAEVSYTENADLDFYAKIMKVVDGCYQIADAEMLFEFAAIVNGGESSACGKLTEDIEVNKNVLATASGVSNVNTTTGAYTGDTTGLREWTPIGYCDENLNCLPFTGIFDGQGHTISGLYYNDENANDVGLFGYVEGDGSTIIKNVGVEDSYFKALNIAGGILGEYGGENAASIENVYSAAVVVAGENAWIGIGGVVGTAWYGDLTVTNAYNVGSVIGGGSMGGIVGYIEECSATIKNSFNYGNVAGDEPLVGFVDGADVSVTNSYYLGDAAQGDYGTVKSADEFADGTVFAALRGADESGSWYQYQGDAYPSLSTKSGTPIHAVTLAFSETDVQYIPYVQGVATSLPTEDNSGNPIAGWTTSADGTGDAITEIPTSATTDLKLYAKVETFKPNAEGYYEIASADDLYKFAEIVNGGNSTAKAKLMNDIVVNENVLATAGGESNVNATTGEYTGTTTGLREWTPINNFNGEFDGDGFSISGLYYNGSENGVGLFGYLLKNGKNVSIKNVGVEDSYFKGNSSVGGILGRVEEGSTVNIENVYNAAFVVAEGSYAGGIVGYDYGNKMSVTNAYNIGQVLALSQQGYAGGIVGRNYSDVESFIKNSYNYGSVSASTNRGEIVGYVDGTTLSVANSYYLADHTGDDGARPASDFENGTVLAALRAGEGGYVWVQAEGDKYPTIDINASKNANTIVLDWTNAADSTALADAGYTAGAMVIVKDGKKFYANGAIYEGILSADQVTAIGDNMLHPVSGIELAMVNDKLVATVNGDSDEPLMISTDVEVSEVVYERVLTKGVYATIMVPFSVPVSSVSGFSFYKFKRVGQTNEGKWAVYVSTVKDSLRANTPYIIVASNNATQITFKLDNYLTLNTTSDVYETTNGNWTMKGVYERKDFLKGDPELGKAYGFAGDTTQVNTRIGRFVKAGDGSYVLPMGVYLVYEEPKMLARPGQMGSSFARINVMPENISVEIEDEEETTVVKHITVAPTFVKSSDRWFDMKGRSLGEKPTAKGTYYHNGQRVIIK